MPPSTELVTLHPLSEKTQNLRRRAASDSGITLSTPPPPPPPNYGPAEVISKNEKFVGARIKRRSPKQVLTYIFSQWLITTGFAACIAVVLITYSNKETISQREKRTFNALITGFSICLGLGISKCLDDMMADLRWWILARRYRSAKEVSLIIDAERTKHIILLVFRSRRIATQLAVVLWISILLASQIGVASLGLCYSTDLAEKRPRFAPGNVSIPDMTSIQTAKIISSPSSKRSAQQYTANSFGVISLAYNTGAFEDIPKRIQLWSSDDPLMFCEESRCRYIFHEDSTASINDDSLSAVTVTTHRSIDVFARCNSWTVIKKDAGNSTTVSIDTARGVEDVHIPITRDFNETIYMTNTSQNCGPGCSIVSVLETTVDDSWYYRCNVTVSDVANATRPEHQVGDDLKAMAGRAMALRGYDALTLAKDVDSQDQIYPVESIFGITQNGSAVDKASLLARFSIGVVAIAGESNDDVVIAGDAPFRGVQLNISHANVIAIILALIVASQSILGCAVGFVNYWVVVPERGAFEVAQACHAMLESSRQLSDSADGKRKFPKDVVWAYRYRRVSPDGIYEIYMDAKADVQ